MIFCSKENMHSLEEIEKVKTAHNIIVADLDFNGEYDIDIIREKISVLKFFFTNNKTVNKTYLQYIKFLELVYFYFEYDTLQNRKFIITLSKNIDNAINSAISNSTKQSRTFSYMDTADPWRASSILTNPESGDTGDWSLRKIPSDTILVKREKGYKFPLDPLDLLEAGMLQNICNFTTIERNKKITKL